MYLETTEPIATCCEDYSGKILLVMMGSYIYDCRFLGRQNQLGPQSNFHGSIGVQILLNDMV